MVSLSAENSKFFGPTVTTISPLIVPYLKQYLAMLEFETAYDDHPHLFSPARDVSRAMTSSQWSAYAKAVVKKYTSVALVPLLLRHAAVSRGVVILPDKLVEVGAQKRGALIKSQMTHSLQR